MFQVLVNHTIGLLDRELGSREAWRPRIVLETLDMHSSCNCILGQLYGDFFKSPDWAWKPGLAFMVTPEMIAEYERAHPKERFDYFETTWIYNELTKAWKKALSGEIL